MELQKTHTSSSVTNLIESNKAFMVYVNNEERSESTPWSSTSIELRAHSLFFFFLVVLASLEEEALSPFWLNNPPTESL